MTVLFKLNYLTSRQKLEKVNFFTYAHRHIARQNIKIITQKSKKTYPYSEQLAVAHIVNVLPFLVKNINNIASVFCLYLYLGQSWRIKSKW